jgi:VanZ family protein
MGLQKAKNPKISKMSFKIGNVRLYLAIANQVIGLSFRWHAIDKYQLRQREEYCFWDP